MIGRDYNLVASSFSIPGDRNCTVTHMAQFDFIPGVRAPTSNDTPANWLMFLNDKPVIVGGDVKNPIPYFDKPSRMGFTIQNRFYLGLFRGEACYAASLDPLADFPMEFTVSDMKLMLAQLPGEWFQLLGLAQQILSWDRHHRYCGACGAPTHFHPADGRRCALTAG